MTYCAKYFSKNDSKKHDKRKFSYSRGVQGNESAVFDYQTVKPYLKQFYSIRKPYCSIGKFSLNEGLNFVFNEENDVNCM